MESNENVNAFVFSFKDDKEINEFFGEDIDQSNDIEQMPSQVSDQPSSEVELQKQTDIKDEDLDQASKTNFSKRMFGKIEAGSIRGSIFNMVILSLGTGCLSLPKSMGDMSLIMGLISIIFTGCASYYTLSIVTSTSEKFQIFNYSKLTRKLFGNIVGFILDLSVLIYIIGILILYQVVSNYYIFKNL